jgi:ssDNA-binding Zn-finger/Zn-ribbon topoisomerase 1
MTKWPGDRCPKCGEPLVIRVNSTNNRQFLGCSRFPDCKGKAFLAKEYTESVELKKKVLHIVDKLRMNDFGKTAIKEAKRDAQLVQRGADLLFSQELNTCVNNAEIEALSWIVEIWDEFIAGEALDKTQLLRCFGLLVEDEEVEEG